MLNSLSTANFNPKIKEKHIYLKKLLHGAFSNRALTDVPKCHNDKLKHLRTEHQISFKKHGFPFLCFNLFSIKINKCSSSERFPWEPLHLAEPQVAGPEVVRPLGHAVSFVYAGEGHGGEVLGGRQAPGPWAASAHQSLWRQQQHTHLAGLHLDGQKTHG